jgi:outer membrane autotransporter protein
LDGFNQSQQFFVPAGSINVNQDTHTEDFFLISAGSQPLSRRGANWLTGDLHTEFQTAILDGDFSFVDGLLDHGRGGETEAMLFASGRPQFAQLGVSDTPPPGSGPWTAWFKGDYASADFAGTGSNFGFGYHGGGGQGGVDYRAADFLLGGAFAYDHENVTQDTTGDHGGINSWRLGGYASYQPGDWSFTGVLAGGFHSIDASRLNLLVMPSASSYGARSFNAAVEAARRFALWGATVQPMLGLVYTNLNVDRFNETGGLLNITGRSTNIGALRGYAGARAYQGFALASGMVLTPEVRARVLYDFLDDARALTATFVDDPTQTSFLVSGLRPARLAGLFGAGATLRLNPMWRAFVGYDAEVRGGNVAHLVTGGLKANW